jgi:hypothetical protein
LIVALLAAVSASGANDPMTCVQDLALPGPRGLFTVIPATVVAHIVIGTDGTAKSVDYEGAKPIFKYALDEYFRKKTRYVKACDGKTINFTIHYRVEGQKTSFPVWEVRFRPPDEIVVLSHPIEPSLDPVRTVSLKSK